MNTFSFSGYSIANLSKEKNGDGYFLEDIKSEKTLIAIVSDGVSQQPHDWLASDTVVKEISKSFIENNSLPLEARIRASVDTTNQKILKVDNNMQATLSLLIWPYETDKIFTCNIGDSRIYRVREEVECLTTDDSKLSEELIRSGKTTKTFHKEVLNKVMGQSGIKFDIDQHSITKDDLILIASDGFYNALPGTFTKKIIELKHSENFEEAFKIIVGKFELFRGDDLTVIGIRHN